jgi:hypothetical protein
MEIRAKRISARYLILAITLAAVLLLLLKVHDFGIPSDEGNES